MHARFSLGATAALLLPLTLAAQTPLTVPEKTDYQRTSTTAEVKAFLDSLQLTGAPIRVTTMGHSAAGVPLWLVIASDPRVTSAAEAKRSGKLVVYVQANIHAGEVEGKEAVQEFLRELNGPQRSLLDKLVILVCPVYNPDGNDAMGPAAVNRSEQNGPPRVGLRPDGLNLDLNRDYLKAEAPETRASLRAIYDTWDPAVMMDLHTTDGTLHGYVLTYSPPLDPNGPTGPIAFARDSILPTVRREMDARHEPIFDYGNVRDPMHPKAWTTYSPLGWYGTNYMGLRGRIGILSEAYSHADFKTRIQATHDFVVGVLHYVADHADAIRRIERAADRRTTLEGEGKLARPALAVRYEAAGRGTEPVVLERVRATGDTGSEGPRYAGTGQTYTVNLPVMDRFKAAETRPLPAGYFLPRAEGRVARLLMLHGIQVTRLEAPWADTVEVVIATDMKWADREFQGHHLLTIDGEYRRVVDTLPAGTFFVSTAQPLGRLVFTLLEPEGYGLARWNVFDRLLGSEFGVLSGLVYGSRPISVFPVKRAIRPPAVPLLVPAHEQ